MRNILLLGAGFSKNWGGPLAKEVFTQLIADSEIRADKDMGKLLWANRDNFEDALAELQIAYKKDPKTNAAAHDLLLRGIARMFERMNALFARQQFYLLNEHGHLDGATRPEMFMRRFAEIYTLNQDLLVEYHYMDNPQFLIGDFNGSSLPGLAPSGQPRLQNKPFSSRGWVPSGPVVPAQNSQPYYKLHGSVNWTGNGMMIMGTGKADAIAGNELLKTYQEVFANSLKQPGTRLTIIGYGFRDDHINEFLRTAIVGHGLKYYLIDPAGAGLASGIRNYSKGVGDDAPMWKKNRIPLEDWFEEGLYSASIIPFRRLLIEESLDREVLNDFLAGK